MGRARPVGLATVAIALDSRVYQAVGFHLNGFFLRVLLQPNAIREAGVPYREVATFVALAVLLLVAEIWLGSRTDAQGFVDAADARPTCSTAGWRAS